MRHQGFLQTKFAEDTSMQYGRNRTVQYSTVQYDNGVVLYRFCCKEVMLERIASMAEDVIVDTLNVTSVSQLSVYSPT
eukprot:1368732-Pyramimonas_sp.AAC.1